MLLGGAIMLMCLRFPEGKKKALTFSYDDGVEQDIRLISIFNKYNLKCTFNINGYSVIDEEREHPEGAYHKRMARRKALEAYNGEAGKRHEIALHSFSHPFLDKLHKELMAYEIVKDREVLESTFGRIIKGFAYPMGTYSDETVDALANAGVKYARTVESTHNFKIPTDWLRMPSTCHHNDPEIFNLADKFVNGTPDNSTPAWLFYVWGHSYEFDLHKNWDRIEIFCDKVANRDDVWYATNVEIYDYVRAYNSLEFSIDGRVVHNPSSQTVWFHYGVDVCVAPGETKKFR